MTLIAFKADDTLSLKATLVNELQVIRGSS